MFNQTSSFLSFDANFELHNVTAPVITISLKTTHVYRAGEAEGSSDKRELGFALQRMEIL